MNNHFADNLPIDAEEFTRRACDPRASVLVEACAGSGKTWLLVSRIVRLLLAGAQPGELLAITFTRRGAQEMRARLLDDLLALARGDDNGVLLDLQQRGLAEPAARAALPDARRLYERVLTARVPITIDTFHGWFWQLLARAPLAVGVPFAPVLLESADRVRRDAWMHFTAQLIDQKHGAARAAWEFLIDEMGDYSARLLLEQFLHKRAEWWSFAAGDEDRAVARALAPLLAACKADADSALRAPDFMAAMLALLNVWRSIAKPGKWISEAIEGARKWRADADGATSGSAANLWLAAQIVLTKDRTPRKVLLPEAIGKKHPAAAGRYAAAHSVVVERLLQVMAERATLRVYKINEAAFACGRLLLAAYQHLKEQQQALDFTDLEWHAYRLLSDPDHAAYLQARLDARYRHILLDEFQDTNPLQWQVLQSWLAAYGPADDADVAAGGRPTVFVVGDPKQSIYRFRRAEPRVFEAALELLRRDYGARQLRTNVTRRNARALIDALNLSLPGGNPLYQPQSTSADGPGAFVLLPLADALALPDAAVSGADLDAGATAGTSIELVTWAAALAKTSPQAPASPALEAQGLTLRDVLTTPRGERESETRYREGHALATEIAHWVRTLDVADNTGDPRGRRPARWADVMLLVRARTHLGEYERALRDAGVPFISDRRGGLLATMEADDLTSLLHVLTAPFSDLKLAHALRSPIFGCSDDDLMQLAAMPGATWWRRLMATDTATDASTPATDDPIAVGCVAGDNGRGDDGATAGSPAPLLRPLARARQLLVHWRALAGVLPVHDLLDRIYYEGDVRRRYAAAAPAALQAQVQANLDAFIELALAVDAGRFPSLPRFIDELANLKQGSDDEAPDQGTTDASDAVRVMTIHGAKGLEAEIVALADAHSAPPAERGRILIAWPPQASAPEHFSFVAAGASDSARAAWFAEEQAQRTQEDWNLLYVAATRARQVLIVSGSAPARGTLEDTWYARLQRAASLSSVAAVAQPRRAVASARKVHDFLPAPAMIGRRVAAAPDSEALRLGRAWHAVLESDDGAPIAADVLARTHALTPMQVDIVQAAASRVRANLPQFFGPASEAELELMSIDGELLRVDRLIEHDDALWIIDFKWRVSDDERAQYEAQVRGYGKVLRAIRSDKPVRLGLVTADGTLLTVAG